MRLRVISPRLRFQIYFLIELITAPFFFMTIYAGFPSFESTVELISWIFVFLLFLFAVLSPVIIEITSFGANWFYLGTTGVTYTTRKVSYHLDWAQVKHIMLSPTHMVAPQKTALSVFMQRKFQGGCRCTPTTRQPPLVCNTERGCLRSSRNIATKRSTTWTQLKSTAAE